jgi:hypothetical protein
MGASPPKRVLRLLFTPAFERDTLLGLFESEDEVVDDSFAGVL